MKISEFRALIKEEVRKVLKESKTTRKHLKEGVIEDLQVDPKTIGVNWEEAENLMDYVKAKHKLGPKKYVAGEGGDVEIYKIGTTPYILVDEDGFGAIFKASDSAKVISAIKDGSYFDWNESVVSQKPLKEAAPKSGQTIDDWDLTDSNMIKPAHQDTWLELLSDVPDGWIRNAARKAKVLQMANAWLSKNGYKWSVADAVSQDEDGVVTWKIGGVNESLKEASLNGTYKDYVSTLDKFLKAKKLKGKVYPLRGEFSKISEESVAKEMQQLGVDYIIQPVDVKMSMPYVYVSVLDTNKPIIDLLNKTYETRFKKPESKNGATTFIF